MTKETVDNSGKGNCMYYAYSISLMYFLLKKRAPEMAEEIFTRLQLTEPQKKQLQALLKNPKLTHFSPDQIVNIIEPILGNATRQMASIQVKEELLAKPKRSSLLTAINYGMLYLFRLELEKNHSPLAVLFEDQEFNLPNFTEAEVYKVFNIKQANSPLHQHIAKHYQTIIDKYISGWPAQADTIYQEKLKRLKKTINEESYVDQQQFIKELLTDKKLDFPQLVKNFASEWDLLLEKTYEESDKTTAKTELATKSELQYQFLRGLMPKEKLKFSDAMQKYPAEWEAYVERIYKEQIFTKEEIRTNDRHQQLFRKEIEEKTTLEFKAVIKQHQDAWSERVEKIYSEKKDSISKDALSVDPFYHNEFLSTLVYETTLEFFTANDNANINKYVAHLNTNYRWGSEETLTLLHDYVQGRHETPNGNNGVDITYDNEMLLVIHDNGVPRSGSQLHRPDLILNNLDNVHWVSLVEPGVVIVSPTVEDKSKITQDSLVKHTNPDKKKTVVQTTLATINSPTEGRLAHLTWCGFNVYLEQLEDKAAELVQKSAKASSEAFALCDLLVEEKKKFLAPNSTMTTQEFSERCQGIIKNAPKKHLETHRGVGMLLNGMMNALIFLANIVISTGNLIYGRYKLIDPNQIQTESIKQVNAIGVSLEALKAIRARDTQKLRESQEQSKLLTASEDATLAL